MTAFWVAWIVIAVAYLALFSTLLWIMWRHRKPTPSTPAAPVGYRENAQVAEVHDEDELMIDQEVRLVTLAAARIATTTIDCGDPTCSGIQRPRAPRPGPAPRPISE